MFILISNIYNFFSNIIKFNLNFNYIGKVVMNSQIQENVKLNIPCYIKDSKIENYTYIGSNSNISNTSIGKFCSIGKNFSCGLGLHPLNGISTSPMFYSTKKQNGFSLVSRNKYEENKNITIGNDVFIGMNVTILDGVKIGNGVVVGACSFVNKDIPDYAIVGGNPAKILKYRFKENEIERLNSLGWWNWDEDKLKNVEKNFFNINSFDA
jgi:virginiamycin A acetyltransferase